jgi:hypothetical protein
MFTRHLVRGVMACIVGVGALAVGAVDAAHAEVPDAGETVATAATAYGQTTITGTMATANDIDMYTVCISDPAAFSVTVGGLGAGSNDGQLFLFDASGLGKAAVDDTGSGGLVPGIPAGTAVVAALAPGEYLLAISNFDRDPVAGGVEIFPSAVGVVGPTITNQPVDGWNGAGNANAMTTYTLTLTGAGCAVPALVAPADITTSATSGAGAVVSYASPTATNFLDEPLSVTCAPPSGSTFPIGTTTVTCSATDALAQTTSDTFTVTVENSAPVVTVPADITTNATSASGAKVPFTATATDAEQGALTPVCTPASGSTFPIGTTVVTCTATDFAGLQATDTFNVTVRNNPPVLTVPANMTVDATSTSGANATFTATATDVEDGTAPVVCTPASGSAFAMGATTVSCTATDSLGATDTRSFVVTVVTVANTSPTTTVPGGVTAAPKSVSGAGLPRTGSDIRTLVLLAGAALAVGFLLRRFRHIAARA